MIHSEEKNEQIKNKLELPRKRQVHKIIKYNHVVFHNSWTIREMSPVGQKSMNYFNLHLSSFMFDVFPFSELS